MNKVSLNGNWTLRYCKIGEATIDNYLQATEKNNAVPCPVPGSVHTALTNAGIIDDPLFDDNLLKLSWIYENEWWHEYKFTLNENDLLEKTILSFSGLDMTADIYLNSIFLCRTENAFIKHSFDVTGKVNIGENTLVVRLDEGLASVSDKDASIMKPSWDNGQLYRVWMRKPQFCYGWDWAPIIPTLGIWQDVCLESYNLATVDNIFVRTVFNKQSVAESDSATLNIDFNVNSFADNNEYRLELSITGDKRYDVQYRQNVTYSVKNGSNNFSVEIVRPILWWPNGLGDPYLYKLSFSLYDTLDNQIAVKTINYGIRKVNIDESKINETEKSFTFVVNDVKIFAKGACWVPCDSILGNITTEKYHALLDSAKEMFFNVLRVWGGGIYEKDEFYDRCDENGLLVWHDFMFACGYYPDFDAEFMESVRIEVVSELKRLRNHACMFGWSGNNEIYSMYASHQRNHPDKPIPLHGRKIYEELLPSLCAEYDPDRSYRPASPYGGDDVDTLDEGDQHSWAYSLIKEFPGFLDIWLYADEKFKFLSECGVLSPMNVESAQKSMKPENLYPENKIWKKHSNTRDYTMLAVEKFFGENAAYPNGEFDLQKYTLMGQAVQAESLRYCFEEFKRKRFYCSGILMWMYTDSYGTSGWTFIDYFLNKKALFYYSKKAFAPFGITYKGYSPNLHRNKDSYMEYYQGSDLQGLDIYVVNETTQARKLTVYTTVYTVAGEQVYSASASDTVPANESFIVDSISGENIKYLADKYNPKNLIAISKLYDGTELINDNRYFFVPINHSELLDAKVDVVLKEDCVELTCSSFVWFTHIATPDGVRVDENDFDLIPNETKIIKTTGLTKDNFKLFSLNPSCEVAFK